MKRAKFFLVIFFVGLALLVNATPQSNMQEQKKAVQDLIKRVLPQKANDFEIEFISKDADDKDIFEVFSKNDKIILRGNNGVSVASAFNYYLKHIAHCQITWNGTNLNLPEPLPRVDQMIRQKSPYKYRYYLNYCTFNYSMSWWDWERWQKEIDWMAMNGINMPLALTGQNSIWREVYKSLGFSDEDLKDFFSGPAYFSWFWMGNLDGWDGPLPLSFMQKQEELQKKILQQERSLGMTPILPAFTGHVPPSFQEKFPQAKIRKTSWVNFPEVCILDPNEPLFTEIGKRFIEEEIRVFGSDHFYSADTFNENRPPSNDSLFLNNISQKVYQSMQIADPAATWIMQGWLFYHDKNFWRQNAIKALLNGIPNDKMIILDLWSERYPVWKSTEAYYGKPWIWNMLHNFGKNINLSGYMSSVAQHPAQALHNPVADKMMGIGLTMEGIEQNPIIYDMMLENVWCDTPIEINNWLNNYALRRYGEKNANIEKAWKILSQSVYADTITNGGPESIITGRPTFKKNPGGTCNTTLPYNPMMLVEAWKLFITASDEFKNSDGYQFDVVDITRQVMADYASAIQQQMAKDYQTKNLSSFRKNSQRFLDLISDMDELLATRKDFLLGIWLEDAKKWGTNDEERKLYEKNARDLITLWGDKDCHIHDYACKQWSGLLNGFYKVRWKKFINQVITDLSQRKEFDQQKFDEQIKDWEWEWVNSNELYPTFTKGDPVKVTKKFYKKYYQQIIKDWQRN
ncbi:MAG TPA: alpha-N-acetylglucosaminidase [Paludibacteraceae bacterium]|nr:alpha-N-acetylglucosaminidase [Paludibacteraceae bacterium]